MALSDAFGFDKPVTTETAEGQTSAHMIPGHVDIEIVHLDIDDISAAQDFMLIDLSDTTNWPHSNTGHIDIAYLIINVNPTSTFVGDIELGFLSSVDAENGDFNGVLEIHMDKKQDSITLFMNYGAFEVSLESAHWFGPITANDAIWQTSGADIVGPDGNAFPSGAGDFVMLVTATTSDVAVGLTVGYRTHA